MPAKNDRQTKGQLSGAPPSPTTISAAMFKSKVLRLLDTVAASGKVIVITKHGKPVARLVPLEAPEAHASGYGFMKGKMRFAQGDDLLSTGEAWEADG